MNKFFKALGKGYFSIASVHHYRFCSNYQFDETIFAISTGNTKAGVSIIRVSGPNALYSLRFLNKGGQLTNFDVHDPNFLKELGLKKKVAHYRKFFDDEDKIIDHGYMIFFPKNQSFTGEDIVEFHIHGSRAVQSKFLSELGKIQTFRPALNGEFTKRAFLNGKLDLLQVEGLSDLIEAETEQQRIQSISQSIGLSSFFLEKLRTDLIQCLAFVEAFIDFESDQEDVKSDVFDKTSDKVTKIISEINLQLQNNNKGEIIRDGFKISLIGPPNSGKSSLLNLLSQRDVAIVSDIPGTTRDILSVYLNIAGFQVNLYDTAGIRESEDAIEKEGVKRSIISSENSHLNLLVVDIDDVYIDATIRKITFKKDKMNSTLSDTIRKNKTVCIINKLDKKDEKMQINEEFISDVEGLNNFIFISCKDQININNLLSKIKDELQSKVTTDESQLSQSIITKARHRIELENCRNHLQKFLSLTNQVDLAGEELRLALICIGRILGRIDVEEVLDHLFQSFCIGK